VDDPGFRAGEPVRPPDFRTMLFATFPGGESRVIYPDEEQRAAPREIDALARRILGRVLSGGADNAPFLRARASRPATPPAVAAYARRRGITDQGKIASLAAATGPASTGPSVDDLRAYAARRGIDPDRFVASCQRSGA
jgi:hypothetical protein